MNFLPDKKNAPKLPFLRVQQDKITNEEQKSNAKRNISLTAADTTRETVKLFNYNPPSKITIFSSFDCWPRKYGVSAYGKTFQS